MTLKKNQSPRVRSNPEDKRAEILNEAIGIIGECGYNGFSIRQLAARCKLTNPGLLHYFGSKEKLLVAVLADSERRDSEALASLFLSSGKGDSAENPHGIAAVRRAFNAIVKRNNSRPELVRLSVVLGAESLVAGHPAGEHFAEKEKRAIETFSEALGNAVPEPELKVRELFAALYGLEVQWLRSDLAFDLGDAWAPILDQLLPAQ